VDWWALRWGGSNPPGSCLPTCKSMSLPSLVRRRKESTVKPVPPRTSTTTPVTGDEGVFGPHPTTAISAIAATARALREIELLAGVKSVVAALLHAVHEGGQLVHRPDRALVQMLGPHEHLTMDGDKRGDEADHQRRRGHSVSHADNGREREEPPGGEEDAAL